MKPIKIKSIQAKLNTDPAAYKREILSLKFVFADILSISIKHVSIHVSSLQTACVSILIGIRYNGVRPYTCTRCGLLTFGLLGVPRLRAFSDYAIL